jgi:hypothetical protein
MILFTKDGTAEHTWHWERFEPIRRICSVEPAK